MTKAITLALLTLALAGSAFAGEKYPLTMTAIFAKGKITHVTRTTYHSGDYDCTDGDEHNAPVCHTSLEWAQLDAIGGTPDTVQFTLADGVTVGVQSTTVTKIPGYVGCRVGTPVIFCDLYFKLLGMTQAPMQKPGKFGQVEWMSTEEAMAAQDALTKKLFGTGNQMKVTMPYKLKGKPDKSGFQRIEVEGLDKGITHILNPLGDGYYVKK